MKGNREKVLELVNRNIKLIDDYFRSMTSTEINELLARLEEIISFYGFRTQTVLSIIDNKGVNENFQHLCELEGITNVILFNLKYKSGHTIVRSKGKESESVGEQSNPLQQ